MLGAAIGGGLTGLTAFGTGMFGLRTARLQLKAQETEAARQRHFESLREWRDPRRKAYADLLDTGQEVLDLVRAFQKTEMSETDLTERIDTLYVTLRKCRAAVAIAGPEAVAQSALELTHAVGGLTSDIEFLGRVTWISPVEMALELFTASARTALEHDGSSQ